MNEQEMKFFSALTADRAESAKMMNKPSMRGIKSSVVEKYSDQAHFIYELLQNADDAKATRARFVLLPDRLIFAHNGTRLFSVTNPSTEDEDTKKGTLGDINAITSIGNSNKTEASIGKFGVGFKAVFQYTATPRVYDPNFRFKIEHLFVPQLLNNDYPGRKKDETMFVFPFDLPTKLSTEAHEDIADKLKSLSYPLLFLSCLKEIEFEIGKTIGLYGKTIKESIAFGNTTADHICLTQNSGNDLYDENLWLFSRTDNAGRRYSVGFFLDSSGRLMPVNKTAFCFFPTKETTNLNFIVHAPFLLTDSREGIRAGVPHNDQMIRLLADLAADSIMILKKIGESHSFAMIDDRIVDIIPVEKSKFSLVSDKSKVSFMPFYDAIINVFKHETIIPSLQGYVKAQNAYWAAFPQIPQLFSNEQLAELSKNSEAKWAFPSIGRDYVQSTNRAVYNYIDSIVRTGVNEDAIITGRAKQKFYDRYSGTYKDLEGFNGIDASFIEAQPTEWLHKLYKWIAETTHRKDISKEAPIFIDTRYRASAAYDSDDQLILFLPVTGMTGYRFVNEELLANSDTARFINALGIKEPALKDQIYNIVLPKYKDQDVISFNTDPDFKLLFNYYLKCLQEELDDFFSMIEECKFLRYYDEGSIARYEAAKSLYYPFDELLAFLGSTSNRRFIAIDDYFALVGSEKKKELIAFVSELGIRKEIQIIKAPIDPYDDIQVTLKIPKTTKGYRWSEQIIDGCKELLAVIESDHDRAKSILLWNTLLRIVESKCTGYIHLVDLLKGKCEYFFRTWGSVSFESSDARKLKTTKWMQNKSGLFVEPGKLLQNDIPAQYNTSSVFAKELFDFLGIRAPSEVIDEEDPNLSDTQRAKIKFANNLAAIGIDISDPEVIESFKKWQNAQGLHKGPIEHPANDTTLPEPDPLLGSLPKMGQKTKRTIKEIISRVDPTDPMPNIPVSQRNPNGDDEPDSDDLLPKAVDFSKKIEQAMQKNAAEISRITQLEDLQNRAVSAKRYSFAWFNALLELEALNSGEENSNSREVSIGFAKVELEEGSQRTLILKHPSRYIPQFMEELADIPLVLHMGDTTKTLAIEVASIKSYTLRVKLKSHTEIQGIDFSKVQLATIDAKSPVFLTEELRKGFASLELADDYDMQANLCSNIEFVFGPPGTGKTTYLAREVLIPLMQRHSDCRVLVLTPTNKSADVLIKKIMDAHGEDKSYEKWLVRFGGTADESIEQSPVFRDKTFDIRSLAKSVTVTTMARFPYDFFMPPGQRITLNSLNWDYIVIDEASMIPLANIVYPLYKKTPKKFIIAGDPFQIEPIASVDAWKDENIYKMVHLDSFKEPKTIPYQYEVKLLTTQYRSVPEIGEVFSRFAYDGILKHHRSSDSQRPLNVGYDLGIETLNIIKYPVSKYESIYRPKKLQHSSSYQVYSALFTYEYLCYLANAIAENNKGSKFSIGVIAPYRAQASLIDKLLASENLPKEIDVQVGTIHGFQGDECDIIFAVLNTPPSISNNKEMFLNRRNIINVSISRARDYLFIVMPDDDTENIENLTLVKRVERLIKDTEVWQEFDTHSLEDLMFEDPNYLENNAFSTGHQNVNVYGLPEKCYEIRSEDNAVDIQVHKVLKHSVKEEPLSDDSASDSFEPSIEDVPEQLRSNALPVNTSGAITGKGFIVPYKGKLIEQTTKTVKSWFIPVMRGGKKKILPVSVCEEEHVIYIAMASYSSYAADLQNLSVVEIQK